MRERLTERQNQVYEFLRTYVRRNGKPPTLKEIGAHLDIRSTNGVFKMLSVLEAKGYIVRTKHEARGIEIVDEVALADDEPPGVRSGSCGLAVLPGAERAHSVVTVLPRITAPAWRNSVTTVESSSGWRPA